MQEGLELTQQQSQDILGARRSLLQQLSRAQDERQAAYSILQSEAQVRWPSPVMRSMYCGMLLSCSTIGHSAVSPRVNRDLASLSRLGNTDRPAVAGTTTQRQVEVSYAAAAAVAADSTSGAPCKQSARHATHL